MNRTIWQTRHARKQKFVRWELDVEPGRTVKICPLQEAPLPGCRRADLGLAQATVVTFTPTRARVVQAARVPSAPSPFLAVTLRASYFIGDGLAGYGPETARRVLRWIVSPDEPWLPPSAGPQDAVPKEAEASLGDKAGGARVHSDGPDTSGDYP
jgi:hypothetical protein